MAVMFERFRDGDPADSYMVELDQETFDRIEAHSYAHGVLWDNVKEILRTPSDDIRGQIQVLLEAYEAERDQRNAKYNGRR